MVGCNAAGADIQVAHPNRGRLRAQVARGMAIVGCWAFRGFCAVLIVNGLRLYSISTRFIAPFNVAAEGLKVMVKPSEIQQALDRPKARIGRARFVLECIVALAFLKAGSSHPIISTLTLGAGLIIVFWLTEKRLRHIGRGDWWIVVLIASVILVFIYGLFCVLYGIPRPDDTIKTNTMPIVIVSIIIPLLVVSLGFIIIILALIKRLRDIKQSAWWLTVLVAPFVVLIIYAISDEFQRQLTSNTYIRVVGMVWVVLYIFFAVALLFRASAFPKKVEPVSVLVQKLSAEKNDTVVNLSGISTERATHIKRQMASRTNQLNGWQRIGIVLSIAWASEQCVVTWVTIRASETSMIVTSSTPHTEPISSV